MKNLRLSFLVLPVIIVGISQGIGMEDTEKVFLDTKKSIQNSLNNINRTSYSQKSEYEEQAKSLMTHIDNIITDINSEKVKRLTVQHHPSASETKASDMQTPNARWDNIQKRAPAWAKEIEFVYKYLKSAKSQYMMLSPNATTINYIGGYYQMLDAIAEKKPLDVSQLDRIEKAERASELAQSYEGSIEEIIKLRDELKIDQNDLIKNPSIVQDLNVLWGYEYNRNPKAPSLAKGITNNFHEYKRTGIYKKAS